MEDQKPTEILHEIIEIATGSYKDPLALVLGVHFLDLGLRQKDRLNNQKNNKF